MDKESTIAFRLDSNVKKAFEKACEADDRTASQVLRAAVKDYIQKQAAQADLFAKSGKKR